MAGNEIEISEHISRITGKIVKALAPEKIILFGSYAYGEVTPDSDIDLLVILNTELKTAERQRMVSRLFNPRRLPMDILVKTPEEIEEVQRRIDPFIHEILEKGTILYARS